METNADLMPGPCSAFQSVNNFGDRFYPKEKSTAWPLLFSIESVTKVVIRLKRKPSFTKVLSNHKTLFKLTGAVTRSNICRRSKIYGRLSKGK